MPTVIKGSPEYTELKEKIKSCNKDLIAAKADLENETYCRPGSASEEKAQKLVKEIQEYIDELNKKATNYRAENRSNPEPNQVPETTTSGTENVQVEAPVEEPPVDEPDEAPEPDDTPQEEN